LVQRPQGVIHFPSSVISFFFFEFNRFFLSLPLRESKPYFLFSKNFSPPPKPSFPPSTRAPVFHLFLSGFTEPVLPFVPPFLNIPPPLPSSALVWQSRPVLLLPRCCYAPAWGLSCHYPERASDPGFFLFQVGSATRPNPPLPYPLWKHRNPLFVRTVR